MPLQLRPYQEEIKARVYSAWESGFKNVLLVMPTGMGKTKTFSSIAIDKAIVPFVGKLPTAILVHRKELVQQISLTLAEEGIVHNIIAPQSVISQIIGAQRIKFRRQFYDYNSVVTVISVDTLNARILKHENWAKSIRLWITDEAAHVLRENKWGRAVSYFPNAIGLGVTATPERLDKRGLGTHADGVFDVMVEGPSARWGIENGFLSNYKIVVPKSDYVDKLKEASDGSDFSKDSMRRAAAGSHIVGDVVENYLKFAAGKQVIVFADSYATGEEIEKKFIERGVAAKLLTAENTDKERFEALTAFSEKKIKSLINIDLFDEGLDVPGIDVVSFARPTMSLSKCLQMCGRGLRPVYAKGFDLSTTEGRLAAIAAGPKPYALLIDHVGNIGTADRSRHGLPDARRKWTLDRIIRRRGTVSLIRICSNPKCNAAYDRALTECPYCQRPFEPERSGGGGGGKPTLEQVDGDLFLLDPETVRQMEAETHLEDPGEVARRVGLVAGPDAATRAMRAQRERIDKQKELSQVIALWAGKQKHYYGYRNRSIHKNFYLEFGMTITEALSETTKEMDQLMQTIKWSM